MAGEVGVEKCEPVSGVEEVLYAVHVGGAGAAFWSSTNPAATARGTEKMPLRVIDRRIGCLLRYTAIQFTAD